MRQVLRQKLYGPSGAGLKSWEIRVFDSFFEKWGGGFAIGFDWVCFSPRMQSRSFS
jgi:hypothetical protein